MVRLYIAAMNVQLCWFRLSLICGLKGCFVSFLEVVSLFSFCKSFWSVKLYHVYAVGDLYFPLDVTLLRC